MAEKATKKHSRGYACVKSVVRWFYRRRTFSGLENLPQSPSLIIGNHAQVHGPMSCELYFPARKKIWCIGQMMRRKEVPAYAYQDFWGLKPKCMRWFYKCLSYSIAPFSAYVFTRADTIGVYKDHRLLSTFRATEKALLQGEHVIVFPENRETYSHIVNGFQDKFVDVARFYYKKHNEALAFVPMYNAPKLRTVVFGKPTYFRPEADIEEERMRICAYIQRQITALAESLPRHKVVPYANVAKKQYVYSK